MTTDTVTKRRKGKNKNRLPQVLLAGSKLLVEQFGDRLAIDGPLHFEFDDILAAARAYVDTLTGAQLGIIIEFWTNKKARLSIGDLVGGSFTKNQQFWSALQADTGFDPARSLFIDDTLAILRSARAFGVAHLLAVRQPDSRKPARDTEEFAAQEDYRELLKGL